MVSSGNGSISAHKVPTPEPPGNNIKLISSGTQSACRVFQTSRCQKKDTTQDSSQYTAHKTTNQEEELAACHSLPLTELLHAADKCSQCAAAMFLPFLAAVVSPHPSLLLAAGLSAATFSLMRF